MDDGATRTRSDDPAPFRAVDAGRFAPGVVVADRYRIVALAGRGGMGEVYRADDGRLGQAVALKFLPAALERDPAARDRLIAEVRNARAVSHPNVCRVYDVGEVEGRYFLTMEYIDGEDLASLLRRIERLPPSKALEVARQLCAGLGAAHERGVLHRDLKPANVMIDGRGKARITDFGLSVESGGVSARDAHAGTIAYMAPERFANQPASVQSDLYALGLILYETYTGKRPFTGASVSDWERAHTDSTPTSPSALVSEIEPAVERIILRCLAKDPAARPLTAAHVAAALPGGDPLAAALAAGETPSPELVAASGEEGTLPRAQAWRALAACLLSLALAVPLASMGHLANLVPSRHPVLQVAEARQILRDTGYTDLPADSAWWYNTQQSDMRDQVRRWPPSARFAPPAAFLQGAIVFCYRQSSRPLFTDSALGTVNGFDPPPLRPDDAYIELDPAGGLRTLKVGGLGFGADRPPRDAAPPWPRLFAAAGLDLTRFVETTPRFTPTFAFDVQAAWQGVHQGQDLRVEAAAYRGWALEFRVLPAAAQPAVIAPYARNRIDQILDTFVFIMLAGSLVALGILAHRNARLGRGDRKGATRIALGLFGLQIVVLALNRHWTSIPLQSLLAVFYCFGIAYSLALCVWLYYLGLEPFVRRRWPSLLISWTRILDGRWRDPLVGRAILGGTTQALWVIAIVPGVLVAVTRWFDLPVAVPWGQSQLAAFMPSLAALFADRVTSFVGVFMAFFTLVSLLLGRLVTRHDRAAWAVVVVILISSIAWSVLLLQPYAMSAPLGVILQAGVLAIGATVALASHGLLGCATFGIVGTALLNTPITADLSRWYAWRTIVVAVLIIAVAAWGFRNVLGRQTAFPEGVLDA